MEYVVYKESSDSIILYILYKRDPVNPFQVSSCTLDVLCASTAFLLIK